MWTDNQLLSFRCLTNWVVDLVINSLVSGLVRLPLQSKSQGSNSEGNDFVGCFLVGLGHYGLIIQFPDK